MLRCDELALGERPPGSLLSTGEYDSIIFGGPYIGTGDIRKTR